MNFPQTSSCPTRTFSLRIKSAREITKNIEDERAKQQETDDGFSDNREKSETWKFTKTSN
jgi:hypothetical protein